MGPQVLRGCAGLVAVVWVGLVPGVASAVDYYVRATGSDAASGLTPGFAFRTIGKGAAALANAGDRVVVGPGVYPEGDITPQRDGIPGRPIVFVADLSGTQTGDAPGPVRILPTAPATTGFLLLGRHHVVIDGFEVVGAADAGVQVRASQGGFGSDTITVRNVTVSGGAKRGIDITASGPVVITNCRAVQNESVGIAVVGGGGVGAELLVVDTESSDNRSHGLFVDGAASGRVETSRWLRNRGSGVLLRNSALVTVTNNTASDNSDFGIGAGVAGDSPASVSDVQLSANLTQRNGRSGIDVSANGELVAGDNQLDDNRGAGLSVQSGGLSLRVSIQGNLASANQSHGVLVLGAHGGAIDANTLDGNLGTGLTVRDSVGLELTSNTISDSGDYGLAVGVTDTNGAPTPVSSDADILVLGNHLDGNAKTAVRVVGSGLLRMANNRVSNSPSVGVAVISDTHGRIDVESNTISDSAAEGLAIEGGAFATVVQNSVQRSIGSGMRIRVGGGATLRDNLVTTSGQGGIDLVASDTVDVTMNIVEDGGNVGLSVVSAPGTSPDVSVQRNQVRRHPTGGIFVDGAQRGQFGNNVVEDIGVAAATSADGLVVRRVRSLELRSNVVRRAAGLGIAVATAQETLTTNLLADGNTAEANGKGGLSAFVAGPATLSNNRSLKNKGGGISVQTSTPSVGADMVGNVAGMNDAEGLFLVGASSGAVRNNLAFSNGGSGITLRAIADVNVVNNLVYANAVDGIAVGTNQRLSVRTTIVQNTVYTNGGLGVRIDGDVSTPLAGGLVLDNIVAGNGKGGISVARSSSLDYVSGFNVNTDGYGEGTRRNGFDTPADPRFINPAGADGMLGGDGYLDDDFRLQQIRAGQSANSPAIDAGSDTAVALGIGGSTASTGFNDLGRVDIGYHYNAVTTGVVNVRLPLMALYVRAAGNDANDGRDATRPLASIRTATELAVAGATIVVGPGTYREGDINVKNASGRVTFAADPSGRSTGDVPGPVVVDATGSDTGFVLLNGGPITLRGFHVTGAVSAGIQVRAGADDAVVEDNVVFSNQRRGIEVLGANRGTIRNNLVYANGTGGVRVEHSQGSSVLNNTVYSNGEDGILVGGSNPLDAATGTSVFRNVVAANGTGIKVQPSSLDGDGYFTGFNVVHGPTPYAANTPRDASDYLGDPLLVDPAGPDGQLGGAGFADDDFHLRQLDDGEASPAVDIDFDDPHSLAKGTTRQDGLPDLGPADSGFHYPFIAGAPALGTVVYVRANGDDSNAGDAPETALASIARAQALGGPGAFIVVGPGHYLAPGLQLGVDPDSRGPLPVLLGDARGVLTDDVPGPVTIDANGGRGPLLTGTAVIDGLRLTGAHGIGLRILSKARAVTARNLAICGNSSDALLTAGDNVDLVNNLICSNGRDGIRATLRRGSAYTRLINNTVTGNAGRAIIVLDSTRVSTRARLFNNVVADNGGVGITLRSRRTATVSSRNNLNTDGYSVGTSVGSSDLTVDPGFIGGAARAPLECPSGDDYRVATSSPALNAGVGTARAIGLGIRSVRSDQQVDLGPADLGYHYDAKD